MRRTSTPTAAHPTCPADWDLSSRALRMVLQSLVLGLGAYLVIYQEATAGVIIASSILVSRTLAPVEIAVAQLEALRGCASKLDEAVRASRERPS